MTSPEEGELHDVLRGKLDALPQPPPTTFRVYLASTGTDMCVERAVLAKNVYPTVREYCRKTYNVEFQVVDLRMGVEFAEDPSGLALRLREIKTCQDQSIGPSFVLLVGQKYGSSALPTAIAAYEFEEIRACAGNPGQMALLETWYSRDDNANPTEYTLRVPNTGSWGPAASEWRETAAEVRRALQEGVRRCVQVGRLDVNAEHKYFVSELENEIEKGLLEDVNANARCLLLQRHLEGVDLNHELAAHFVDLTIDGELDTHKQSLMDHLTGQRVAGRINSTNIHRFTVEWSAAGGIDEEEHAEYLQELCEALESSLTKQIDAAMSRVAGSKVLWGQGELLGEVLQHLHTCATQHGRIYGRDAILQRIRHYVIGDINQPLVLHGAPGIGKTCILAKAASLVSLWLEDDPSPTVLIVRFLGTTPASSNIDSLVRSLCNQIHTMFDDTDCHLPEDMDELLEYFQHLLQEVPPHLTIVILLDSIDALRGDPVAQSLQWLPNRLPENIKLILTTVDTDHGKKVVKDLQRHRISKRQFVEIYPLDQENCKTILRSWMKTSRRQLNHQQWRAVDEAIREGCSPLYLKMLREHVLTWTSSTHDTQLPEDIEAFFSRVIDDLQEKHGEHLVATVMVLLVLSKQGVTEMEIEDMLSLDDEVLTDVFKDYIPPVRRVPGILWCRLYNDLRHYTNQCWIDNSSIIRLSHSIFEKVIRRCFMVSWVSEVNSRCKNLLINYYSGTWAEDEKPYKLTPQQQRMLGMNEPEAGALRYVPAQPTMVRYVKDGKQAWHINKRKIRQLASVLHSDATYWDNEEALFRFMRVVLFNWEMLMAILMMKEWQLLMRCLTIRHIIDEEDGEFEKRQLWIYMQSLQEVQPQLLENPSSAMIYLLGRFINSYNFLMHPSTLVRQADKPQGRAFCALVCPNQQMPLAGEVEYLTARHHTSPIRNCLFIGNVLFTVSDRLVGTTFDCNGQNVRTVVNAKLPGVPERDYFHLVVPMDEPTRGEVNDEDSTDNLLLSCQLVLALHHQPKLFFVSASDGNIMRIVDCRKDLPKDAKQSVITKVQVIPNLAHDHVVYVTMSEGPLVLSYSCSTGQFIDILSSKDTILDIVQMEDGQYCVFLANGDILPLDDVQAGPSELHQRSTKSFSTLKYGNVLTAWNKGKWGSPYSDVLVVGLETGHLSAHFGVNPHQAQSGPPLTASVRIPDQTPIHHIDTDVKGFRTRMAYVLACSRDCVHLVKYEVGRNKQCSVQITASLRKRLQEAFLYDEVIVGRQMNAVHVISIAHHNDGRCYLQPIAKLDVHNTSITVMNIMPGMSTGRLVATVGAGGACKAFHLSAVKRSHQHLSQFDRMEGPITKVITGMSLAATMEQDNTYIAVWDAAGGTLVKQFHHNNTVIKMCLSQTERYLATIDCNHELSVWDILTLASQMDCDVPLLTHSLKGSKHWVFWCQSDPSFLIVCDSGQHVKITPKTRQVTETENPLVPKPLLDVVLNHGDEVLALGLDGSVLTAGEPCSTKDTHRLDLKAKTGLSVSKYGSKVWQVDVWSQNTLLLIGDTLLCCKHTSNSIFPLHKGMSTEAVLLPAGPTLGFINRGQLSVLTDINGNWVDYPHKIQKNLAAITPDGEYVVCVDDDQTVRLIRVQDQMQLACFRFLVGITSLSVSADGYFAILGCENGRLYPYTIADPDDPSHIERISGLPSRQQPVILSIERPHDPRYKIVRNMTSQLETESFAGSEKNSDDENDDDDSDDSDSDSEDDSEDDSSDDSEELEDDEEEEEEEDSDESEMKRGGESNNNEPNSDGVDKPRGSSKGRRRQKSAKKSVFMPLPNGAVCLAPVAYHEPVLQSGYKNRIQKISNRFTEVDIQEDKSGAANGTDEAAGGTGKTSADVRKIWTAPPERDPRKASSRLKSMNSRKATSMSSPRPSSRGAEDGVASRACVIS